MENNEVVQMFGQNCNFRAILALHGHILAIKADMAAWQKCATIRI